MYIFHLAVHQPVFKNDAYLSGTPFVEAACRFDSYIKTTSLDGIHPRNIGFMIIQIEEPTTQDISEVNQHLERAMEILEGTHPLEHSHLERRPYEELPHYELNMIYASDDRQFIKRMKYPRTVLTLEKNDLLRSSIINALKIFAPEIKNDYAGIKGSHLWVHRGDANNMAQAIQLVEYRWDSERKSMIRVIEAADEFYNEKLGGVYDVYAYRNYHLHDPLFVSIPRHFNASEVDKIDLYLRSFILYNIQPLPIDESFGDSIFLFHQDFKWNDERYDPIRSFYCGTVLSHTGETGISEEDEYRMTEILRRVKKGEMLPKPHLHMDHPMQELWIPDFLRESDAEPDNVTHDKFSE